MKQKKLSQWVGGRAGKVFKLKRSLICN